MFDLPGVTTVGGEFVTNKGEGSGLGLFLSFAKKKDRYNNYVWIKISNCKTKFFYSAFHGYKYLLPISFKEQK